MAYKMWSISLISTSAREMCSERLVTGLTELKSVTHRNRKFEWYNF